MGLKGACNGLAVGIAMNLQGAYNGLEQACNRLVWACNRHVRGLQQGCNRLTTGLQ